MSREIRYSLARGGVVLALSLLSMGLYAQSSENEPSGRIAEIEVPVYGVFETKISNDNNYQNPFDFREVELYGRFTSPTSRVLEVTGFFDGDGLGGQTGDAWTLRFMPDEVGTWNYTYAWRGTGAPASAGEGEVVVVPSERKGPLKLDPDHPHAVIHANGDRFFWNGDTEWFFLSDDFSQADRDEAIDFLAEHRVNNFLITLVNDDVNDVFPWLSRTDKAHFDLEKLRRWEAVVQRLGEHGIVADLWFYSDDSIELIPSADSPEEDLFFKYIVARFSHFENVTWNVGLEYNEYRSDEWASQQAGEVKAYDPYDHLVAAHRTDDVWPFPGDPNFDHTSLQYLGATHSNVNEVVVSVRRETAERGRPLPIFHEEFFIEGRFGDPTQFRQSMWAIVTGGGFIKSASLGFWIGTGYREGEHFDIQDHCYNFMVQVPYWRMAPDNSLVRSGEGYVLADTGNEYVAYLPSGGKVALDLSEASGSLNVEWYDPRRGDLVAGQAVEGGGIVDFSPPYRREDWVLHVGGPPREFTFRRGDADGDGRVAPLRDALHLLSWGFLGGEAPRCLDAADVDGNGTLEPGGDAFHLISWAFFGGEEPPDPGTENCGVDPSGDSLGCGLMSGACR